MKPLIKFLGVLRFGLLVLVVVDILLHAAWLLLGTLTDFDAAHTGWQALPALIAPVMAPILFVVLVFDIVMSSVHSADNPGEAGERHRRIRRIDIAFVALLLLYWLPFFFGL